MNEFVRSNKVRGIRWMKSPIENIKIRVNLKTQDSILTLPKFEDYSNEVNSLNLENNVQEYIFKWQEKRFSKWEYNHYGDILNCITDLDVSYNDLIKSGCIEQKVFSYIHAMSTPLLNQNKIDTKSWIGKFNERIQTVFHNDSISMQHLFKSEDNINIDEVQWSVMHIVFDNSTYTEDSEVLIKQDIILTSLYYNKTKHYLIISPDANDLEMNPYTIDLEYDMVLDYHYSIELIVDEQTDEENDDEYMLLLQKLYEKWTKQHSNMTNFIMAPLGKKKFYVTLEIVTATNFDMDNIYIEYNIKTPDGVVTNDSQNGRTHISEATLQGDVSKWHYGHLIELSLETDNDTDIKPLKIFFEAISMDWWGRHRTEGYAYVLIPLSPGEESKSLVCSRPAESDTISAESRRFYLGGCHLIKDLDVLVQPEKDPTIVYKSTGQIFIRWSTICQSSTPRGSTWPTPGSSAASALLGAEAALSQYRKARAKLKAATRDLEAGDG